MKAQKSKYKVINFFPAEVYVCVSFCSLLGSKTRKTSRHLSAFVFNVLKCEHHKQCSIFHLLTILHTIQNESRNVEHTMQNNICLMYKCIVIIHLLSEHKVNCGMSPLLPPCFIMTEIFTETYSLTLGKQMPFIFYGS